METLHERLAELASVSDQRRPETSAVALADRGRRYGRRRRRGSATLVAVCVLALVAIGGWSSLASRDGVEPAPAGAPVGLPERIYEPSPWLGGTADEPPGRLSVLLNAERGTWRGTEDGVVGISAATGAYRFLDLPDAAGLGWSEVALAPDGVHVAYWTTGETARSPNTTDGASPAAGVAIYDTVSGKVQRHAIDTDHGILPEGLFWLDRTTLLLGHGQYFGGDDDTDMKQSMSTFATWQAWSLDEAAPAPTGLPAGARVLSTDSGRVVLGADDAGEAGDHVVMDVSGEVMDRVTLGPNVTGPVLDAVGPRFAYVAGGRNPNRVLVGRMGDAEPETTGRRVPRSGLTFEVLGWTDAEHLALFQRQEPLAPTMPEVLRNVVRIVDVRTGDSRQLTVTEGMQQLTRTMVATDLLAAPSLDTPEPPRPPDPRLVTGALVVVGVVGLWALLAWRRRVRP